jgi:hypothetical protein
VLETGPSVVEEEPTMMLKRDDMASEETVEASREARKEGRKGREGNGEKIQLTPSSLTAKGVWKAFSREKREYRIIIMKL